MSPERAFLQHIADDPDDDAPRLVFADWLQEHGGPAGAARAELVRVQCEAARLPEGDPRGEPLRRRAADLLRAVWPELSGRLPANLRYWL
jgi:uncharacterized protein (TIGR02996 family)